jgi:hydrogenase nickel incorporation protein HypB
MCTTCGCSDGAKATIINLKTGETKEPGPEHSHEHHDQHGHAHEHHHGDHGHEAHDHSHDHHHHDHTHGSTVSLEQAVLHKNNELAMRNRAWLAGREILMLNLVSSPGAGKTTLLERTLEKLAGGHEIFVIEGDQATANDGERIKAAGAPVVQVNTGTGCHLEADMVARGLQELKPSFGATVLIENVGNLVCPALFDLGEHAKVAIVSVTEGEDKPLKYPHMFKAAELVLVNKSDLLPYLEFDLGLCLGNIAQVNPDAHVITLSARTGAGMDEWCAWVDAQKRSISSQLLA